MDSSLINATLLDAELWIALGTAAPTCLWMGAALLYALSLSRKLNGLATPALCMGILGTLLGWLTLDAKSPLPLIPNQDEIGVGLYNSLTELAKAALVFSSAVWLAALILQALRNKLFYFQGIGVILRTAVLVASLIGISFGAATFRSLGSHHAMSAWLPPIKAKAR